MLRSESVKILLVEDNPGHARLIEKNLRRSAISNEIVVLDNGQKAVDYLLGNGKPGKASLSNGHAPPFLLLLDLNLPVLDGYEVLKLIKKDERTRHIPVIVLTTTDNPNEISRCYELGCNVYITKPVDYDKFSKAIRNLGLFLSVVKIPNEGQ